MSINKQYFYLSFMLLMVLALALFAWSVIFFGSIYPADHFTYLRFIENTLAEVQLDGDNINNVISVLPYVISINVFGDWGIVILNGLLFYFLWMTLYKLLSPHTIKRYLFAFIPYFGVMMVSINREIFLMISVNIVLIVLLYSNNIFTRFVVGVFSLALFFVRPVAGVIFLLQAYLNKAVFRNIWSYLLFFATLWYIIITSDFYWDQNVGRLSHAIEGFDSIYGEHFLQARSDNVILVSIMAYNSILNLFGGLLVPLRTGEINTYVSFSLFILSFMTLYEVKVMLLRRRIVLTVWHKLFISMIICMSLASWVWGPRYVMPFIILLYLGNDRLVNTRNYA